MVTKKTAFVKIFTKNICAFLQKLLDFLVFIRYTVERKNVKGNGIKYGKTR